MRRLASTCVLVVCLLAGCGGDNSAGPLDASLSYLPESTPFAVAIDTDLEGEQWKSVDSILERFPLGLDAEELLGSALGEQGLSFRRDVAPVLGNPFVVSAASVDSFVDGGGDRFVAAIEVDDQDKLDALIEKTGARESGEVGGATLYQEGDTIFAVDDGVVVFGESRAALERAVERADGDEHLDQETFEEGLAGLPENGLAQVYFDLGALLASDPDTQSARRIESLGAVQLTLGMSASVSEERVEVEMNVRTEGEDLDEDDLPIAAGDEAPPVIENPGEIRFGIRNPAQIVRFAEQAAQAVDPEGYGQFGLAKETLNARFNIDIDKDLIGALTGNLSGSVGPNGDLGSGPIWPIRRRSGTPFARPPGAAGCSKERAPAGRRFREPAGGNGLWVLRQSGGQNYYFGVVGDRFVLASDRARAVRLADQPAVEVEGAEGAVVMGADGQQLLNQLLGVVSRMRNSAPSAPSSSRARSGSSRARWRLTPTECAAASAWSWSRRLCGVETCLDTPVADPALASRRREGLSVAASAVRVARELLAEPRSRTRQPRSPARPTRGCERTAAGSAVPEPEHVDEGLVVVAEVAEEGAEEGAGAEVHVDEPWDGYRAVTAADIRARLADADATVAAAVKLSRACTRTAPR